MYLKFSVYNLLRYNTFLEIIWNFVPIICLGFIALPSFSFLYSVDELVNVDYLVKILGNQWYWTYEFTLLDKNVDYCFTFDSRLVKEEELIDLDSGFRLLEVDQRLSLLQDIYISLIITSTDVLHSWAIPSLGIKSDACPGRLNQIICSINRIGVYYGQCSEICGLFHAFMPIVVSVDNI